MVHENHPPGTVVVQSPEGFNYYYPVYVPHNRAGTERSSSASPSSLTGIFRFRRGLATQFYLRDTGGQMRRKFMPRGRTGEFLERLAGEGLSRAIPPVAAALCTSQPQPLPICRCRYNMPQLTTYVHAEYSMWQWTHKSFRTRRGDPPLGSSAMIGGLS